MRLARLSAWIALPVALAALALHVLAAPPPACASGACGGACNPHKGIWCNGAAACVCHVQGADGWGSCIGGR